MSLEVATPTAAAATTETNVETTFQQWVQKGLLSQIKWVTYNDENNQETSTKNSNLECQGIHLPSDSLITLSYQDKSCTYSLASVWLQSLYPTGLVQYRQECKKYNINDPVKATDKSIVLASLGIVTHEGEQPPPQQSAPQTLTTSLETQTTTTDASHPPPMKKSRKDKTSTEQQQHGKKKEQSSSSTTTYNNNNKQPKQLVTNEQLFDRLNVVVDKRQIKEQQEHQKQITMALSTEGFANTITPELLQQYQEQTLQIIQQEIPVGNSASILRASNPQKDLSRVLELYQEATKQWQKQQQQQQSKTSTTTTTTTSNTPMQPNHKAHLVGQKPVILVPKGMTAPLTMINAYEFLANAKYIPRDVMLQQQQQQNKQQYPSSTTTTSTSTTIFTRQVNGRSIEYEIIDNPRKLGSHRSAWDRVVAVIVLGQSWQFKDWVQGYHIPATLFDQVYGFYITMEGDTIPTDVTTWNVHIATLNRDKRGLDQVAYASFWNGLDEWMKVRKPELLL